MIGNKELLKESAIYQKAGERLDSFFWNKSFSNFVARKDYSFSQIDLFLMNNYTILCTGDYFIVLQFQKSDTANERYSFTDIKDTADSSISFTSTDLATVHKEFNGVNYTIIATEYHITAAHSPILNLENWSIPSGGSQNGFIQIAVKNSRSVSYSVAVKNQEPLLIDSMNECLNYSDQIANTYSPNNSLIRFSTLYERNGMYRKIYGLFDIVIGVVTGTPIEFVPENGSQALNLMFLQTIGGIDYYTDFIRFKENDYVLEGYIKNSTTGAIITPKRAIVRQWGNYEPENYQYPSIFPVTNGILNRFLSYTNRSYYANPIHVDTTVKDEDNPDIDTAEFKLRITNNVAWNRLEI